MQHLEDKMQETINIPKAKKQFHNFGTEDYREKDLNSIEVKPFKEFFEIFFGTENSVKLIILTKEQKDKLKQIL